MPLAKRLKGQPGKVGKWVTPEKVTEDFQNMVWDIQRQIPALLQKDKAGSDKFYFAGTGGL